MTDVSSAETPAVTLTIDGRSITVPQGTTLYNAARALDIAIPVLCHSPSMAPVGVCRLCVVEVGERVLAASCVRECAEGMQVTTASEALQQHRKTLTGLLISDYPDQSAREQSTGSDELLALARQYGLGGKPYTDGTLPGAEHHESRPADASSAVIAVAHEACILCDRCIRACDDLQHNDVITRTGKGYTARIAFDLDQPMGNSSCVACGECMAACPTGALTNKALAGLKLEFR